MLQAAVLDGLSFDPFSHVQNGLSSFEVDVGGREVFQALVIVGMIVVLDEVTDVGGASRFVRQHTLTRTNLEVPPSSSR